MELIVNGRLQITQIEHLDYKLLIKAEQRENENVNLFFHSFKMIESEIWF